MVLLGFTIARDINPNLKTIVLDDTSSFMCSLPNTTNYKVPMKPFHIAFHRETWYEHYFDARPIKRGDVYLKLKENFDNPEKKPTTFNFRNDELQEELEPLYARTATWAEFFDIISKTYGKKKCGVVYPWIVSAINSVFEGDAVYDSTEWVIDFEENYRKNKTPLLNFTSHQIAYRGGGNRTRKRGLASIELITHYFPDIPEIQGWNYKKFLHGRYSKPHKKG